MIVTPPISTLPAAYPLSTEGHGDASADATRAVTQTPAMIAPLAHATRDLAGQLAGRTVGLAIYTATASLIGYQTTLTICAGAAGALSGASLAAQIAAQQIGTSTTAQQLASISCVALGALAGGAIGAIGSTQPVVTLAVGGTLTAAVSVMRIYAQNTQEHASADACKGIVAFMGTAATLTAVATVDHQWRGSDDIASRNLGTLGESLTIEFFKSTLERVGPSVNRQALNFNGKMLASLAGTLPYVAATVVFNGLVSGLLQPSGNHDSHRFNELILPLLIGALSNAVRGFVNATAVQYVQKNQSSNSVQAPELVRPHQGLQAPDTKRFLTKTAIRFFISSCRNAVYTKLRSQGLSIIEAASIAQLVYGFFAQNRDIVFDLIQSEGWHSEPAPSGKPAAPVIEEIQDNERN